MSDDKKSDLSQFDEKRVPSRAVSPNPSKMSQNVQNNPVLPIAAYCGSSILMTVTNKYVLSGLDFNLNFFLLLVQVGPAQRLRALPPPR